MRKAEDDIILEYSYSCSMLRLWRALTELDEMQQWYFQNIPEFKAELGFQTAFIVKNEGRIFTHQWIVLECQPPRRLSYSWVYKEWKGRSVSHFRLSGSGMDHSVLELRIEILEDFEKAIPEFKRESCIEGWNYFLGERLKDHLDGTAS